MQRWKILRGYDAYGIVHIDSHAKETYIWPMCSTGRLNIKPIQGLVPATCLECIGVDHRVESTGE